MKRQYAIYARGRTTIERFIGAICESIFLFLCILFSYSQGGGAWTFLTASILILSIWSKTESQTIYLNSKQEAVAWANSLQEDEKS